MMLVELSNAGAPEARTAGHFLRAARRRGSARIESPVSADGGERGRRGDGIVARRSGAGAARSRA